MNIIFVLMLIVGALAVAGAVASLVAGIGALRQAKQEGIVAHANPELKHR